MNDFLDRSWGFYCPSFVLADFVNRAGGRQTVRLQLDLIINGKRDQILKDQKVWIISCERHEDNPVIADIELSFVACNVKRSGICDLGTAEAFISFSEDTPLLPPEWWGFSRDFLPRILRSNKVERLEDLDKFTALQICQWFEKAAPEDQDTAIFAANCYIQIYDTLARIRQLSSLPSACTVRAVDDKPPTKVGIQAALRDARRE